MFAHGIMTGLFFALIGFIYEQTHTRAIADISGLMRRTPLVAACFVIAGASSMGLPSTAGFVAELLVYVGLVIQSPWLAAAAFVGVVVTAAYVLRMLSRILLGEPSAGGRAHPRRPAAALRADGHSGRADHVRRHLPGVALHDDHRRGVLPIVAKLAGG